jgi:hypothetical protein
MTISSAQKTLLRVRGRFFSSLRAIIAMESVAGIGQFIQSTLSTPKRKFFPTSRSFQGGNPVEKLAGYSRVPAYNKERERHKTRLPKSGLAISRRSHQVILQQGTPME